MKYAVRGYVFKDGNPIPIIPGKLIVKDAEMAHKTLQQLSEYYLFTLDEISEEEGD